MKEGDLVKWRWGNSEVPDSSYGIVLKLENIAGEDLDGAWIYWIDLDSKTWTPLAQLVLLSPAF